MVHTTALLYRNTTVGTSLAVQWLRLHASTAGARVQSLVGELRSHMPLCAVQKKNKKQKTEIQLLLGY